MTLTSVDAVPKEQDEVRRVETDEALVAAIRSGNTAAWGAAFDRHRDVVWRVAMRVTGSPSTSEDVVQNAFITAVERLDQLREPARFRPWLLAIARRAAVDELRRRRDVPTDEVPVAPLTIDPGADLARVDTIALVEKALAGLEPRDRLALELADREEIDGDDLAEILGVSRNNAYTVLHNARSRFGQSVEAVLVAAHGRGVCPDLDRVLDNWDGTLTPLIRKRVARHISRCATCDEVRRRETQPAALLAILPVAVVPAAAAARLRQATIETAPSGVSATPAGMGLGASIAAKPAAAAVAAVMVVAATIAAIVVVARDDSVQDSTAAPAPTEITETVQTTTLIEMGATSTAPAAIPVSSPPSNADPAIGPSFCDRVGDLEAFGAGPTSPDPADLERYLRDVDAALDAVAAFPEATPTIVNYAAAYRDLVAAEAWNNISAFDDPGLRDLRAGAEADLSSACR